MEEGERIKIKLNGNGQVIQTMQGNLEDYYDFNVNMNPYVGPVNQQGIG